jgi:vacuolar-type H+-ATPase subunit E/Vma4
MVDKANEAITAVERAQNSAFKSGNERAEAMLRLQKELLDTCEQASRDWLTRLKSETELWSGLATKLAETRSVPDAIRLYQDCLLQRVEMAKADAQRLSNEWGTIMQKVNRSLTPGWSAGTT